MTDKEREDANKRRAERITKRGKKIRRTWGNSKKEKRNEK